MGIIDCRTLLIEALNERRRCAVRMGVDGVSLQGTAARCDMSRSTVIAAQGLPGWWLEGIEVSRLQEEYRWNIIGCALKSDILIDFMRRTIRHAG